MRAERRAELPDRSLVSARRMEFVLWGGGLVPFRRECGGHRWRVLRNGQCPFPTLGCKKTSIHRTCFRDCICRGEHRSSAEKHSFSDFAATVSPDGDGFCSAKSADDQWSPLQPPLKTRKKSPDSGESGDFPYKLFVLIRRADTSDRSGGFTR